MDAKTKEIAALRATGLSCREIEAELGISKSKVATVLKQEDVKALVEREYNEFLQALPTARRNIQSLIERHDSLDPDDKDKQRAWASSMEMLRSAGILPGNLSQLTINNIQINNQQVLSPILSDLLSKMSESIVDVDTT